MYTDTDSLKIIIYGENAYRIEVIENIFDTYNFDVNTNKPLKPKQNEKKLGLLKFENAGNPMCKLIAVVAKSYMEIFPDNFTLVKAKGCKHGYKKNITADDVKNTILNEKPCQIKQTQIISEGLEMKKVENTKYVINNLGNKREVYYRLNKTIAWGHKAEYLQSLLKIF